MSAKMTLEEIEKQIALAVAAGESAQYETALYSERILEICQEQAAELVRRPRVGLCVWTLPDLQDRSFWSTTCGHEWQFLDGSPSENDAKFCPFCGGEIEEDAEKTG